MGRAFNGYSSGIEFTQVHDAVTFLYFLTQSHRLLIYLLGGHLFGRRLELEYDNELLYIEFIEH